MLKLFILADDMTGTLDTAIKFIDAGVKTRVAVNENYKWTDEDVEVLVMNTATRHNTAEKAYSIVYEATRKAVEAGVPYLYKKVDSSLRGNIGAELTAMLEASGKKQLSFVPAFPQMGRTTSRGNQLLDGMPMHETVFGSDPFESVTTSYIPDIIAVQSNVQTTIVPQEVTTDAPGVNIYDCISDQQLEQIVKLLAAHHKLSVMAGCAGFAAFLPKWLCLHGKQPLSDFPADRLLALCGSVNPITRKQISYAQKHGFKQVLLRDVELPGSISDEKIRQVCEQWLEGAPMIVATDGIALREGETFFEAREHVSENLSNLLAGMLNCGIKATLLITGGDTLLAVLNRLGITFITPIREVTPGAVYSTFMYNGKKYDLISKAGGFGSVDFFVDMNDQLHNARREDKCTQ